MEIGLGLGVIVLLLLVCSSVVTSTPYVVNYEESKENEVEIEVPTNRPMLGIKRCTRGPAYWCHNITQAKECGAVKHCIGKVWEHMKLPEDNDDVCDICKEMVKEARDQLLSNETQDELREVLEGSCKLIPVKIVANECCQLADEFIPELIDALASRMDPQVVCAVSGLCNSVRIDEMLGQMKEIEQKSEVSGNFDLLQDSCPKCAHYVGKFVESLKKLTKDELLHKIFEVCGHLGSYSDACRATAMDDIDTIYAYVQNDLNPTEACGVIGLCEVVSINPVKVEGLPNGVQALRPPLTDYQCDFCKQLVTYLKNWFTTDTTKEEFKEIITGLCKQTGKYADECLKMANEYGDLVYNLIVEELDPVNFCTFIEQCNNATQGRVKLFSSATNPAPLWTILHSDTSLTKLTAAEKWTGDDERPSHQPGFSYPLTKLQPAEKLTGDDEKPLVMFPMMKLTPAEKITGAIYPSVVAKKGVMDILPTCGICTFTVGKLFEMLAGKNRTKEAIDNAMERVCNVIPTRYKEECLVFMREYGETVAEMILIDGTAHGICTAIGLCFLGSPAQAQDPKVPLVVNAGLPFDRYMPQVMVEDELEKMDDVEEKPSCPLCEFVIARLGSMLKDNATEEEIKETVEQVCKIMPRTLRTSCRDFIEEYGDTVIDYFRQKIDPEQICTELKLCKGRRVSESAEEEYPMDLTGMNKCELCELISSYLSAFLDDPTVDTSIENLVEKVCPLLPKNHEKDCKELIEDYGPYLLSLLAQATDKGKACAAVNLCPATA